MWVLNFEWFVHQIDEILNLHLGPRVCRLSGEFEGHAYRVNINYQWEALEEAT